VGAFRPLLSLTFDAGNLKFHDLVFQTDYDEIELKNQLCRYFNDVIIITLPKSITKITSQNFSFGSPSPIKISGFANEL